MKRKTMILILTAAMAVFCIADASAQSKKQLQLTEEEQLELAKEEKELNDSLRAKYGDLFFQEDSIGRAYTDSIRSAVTYGGPEPHKIITISRSYGDCVALRWAPSDYITWTQLNRAGYLVLREDNKTFETDTIAVVKPLTLDEFKAKFGEDDDMAAGAAELIWGDHSTNNTAEANADMNPFTAAEAAEDQENIFSSAMLLAELRHDIAEAMALGYTDRNVQKGREYMYVVVENLPAGYMHIEKSPETGVKLADFKPEKLDINITDSVSAPRNITIFWPQTRYTAYDIERRQLQAPHPPKGGADNSTDNTPPSGGWGAWAPVNKRPYVMMMNTAMPENSLVQYTDSPDEPGTYEYRIVGYDSFGDKSLPSDIHRVILPDLVPPTAPSLKRIVVDHHDEEHATAHIYFTKDSIEADLEGYMPMYKARFKWAGNKQLQNLEASKDRNLDSSKDVPIEVEGEWRPMVKEWIAPGDTVFHCDVSGLPSGDICIMVKDTANNYSTSIPQYIFLEDFKAPAAPDSLRANVAPDGTVVLRWNAPLDPDVRYYEVYSANDTTHTFMKLTSPDLVETVYVDSIAPGLNQAFIYYEVRAVDYSGNTSLPSNRLRVVRPNFMPPQACRIDSLYNDETHVYMRWIQPGEQDLAFTRLLRRKRPSQEWEILAIYPADSVRAQGNFICITDYPKPDMKNRYEYAMDAFNLNGVSSGLSLVSSVLHTGPKVLNIPINLEGTFDTKNHETRLAWEVKNVGADLVSARDGGTQGTPLQDTDWWYCVYRKGEDDKRFEFLLSTDKSENYFSDHLLKPGQTAEYYVKIRLNDGRFSQNSNTIKVTAPKEQ